MTSLRIIIVGAGIAGLATAISLAQKTQHEILVLESSSILTEAGAGIQCSAGASRLLNSWGLKAQLEAVATRPDFIEIRRYDNFKLLGRVPHNVKNYSERLRGSPHWFVHRVDYQKILAETAVKHGVKIKFAQKVLSIDIENLQVRLEDEQTLEADLIIGGDGIHSKVRQSIPILENIKPRRGQQFCYRALIPREKMLGNALSAGLMGNHNQQAWAGQDKHIIAYPIGNGSFYNVVLMEHDHDDAPLGRYNSPGDVEEMRRGFKDFNEVPRAVLDNIDSCAKWVIGELPNLPTWASENKRVVLVGDACHAMVPHAASGAVAALEDAEVLGLCIAACKTAEDLKSAVEDYELLRKPRCERVQEISRENGTTFTLPDGPAQQARDKIWAAQNMALDKQLSEDAPLVVPEEDMNKQYPHPSVVQWLQGHDVAEEARKHLANRPRALQT